MWPVYWVDDDDIDDKWGRTEIKIEAAVQALGGYRGGVVANDNSRFT